MDMTKTAIRSASKGLSFRACTSLSWKEALLNTSPEPERRSKVLAGAPLPKFSKGAQAFCHFSTAITNSTASSLNKPLRARNKSRSLAAISRSCWGSTASNAAEGDRDRHCEPGEAQLEPWVSGRMPRAPAPLPSPARSPPLKAQAWSISCPSLSEPLPTVNCRFRPAKAGPLGDAEDGIFGTIFSFEDRALPSELLLPNSNLQSGSGRSISLVC
mmetsp:Transcript_61312/g.200484  ORF Transcript_61312/g.200484 Transcript_61312/m.200484 type:complete len:215 (-) Transcript_61312:3338-3982(-)